MNYTQAKNALDATSSREFCPFIKSLKSEDVIERIYAYECETYNRRIIKEKLLARLRAVKRVNIKKEVAAL